MSFDEYSLVEQAKKLECKPCENTTEFSFLVEKHQKFEVDLNPDDENEEIDVSGGEEYEYIDAFCSQCGKKLEESARRE